MENIQSITITYTMQELQALTRLLDVAAKAAGLAVAGDIAVLHAKHLAAVQAPIDAANEEAKDS